MRQPYMSDPVYVRYCGCGLMVAGTARQILDQCDVHWRRSDCPWVLHETKPGVR